MDRPLLRHLLHQSRFNALWQNRHWDVADAMEAIDCYEDEVTGPTSPVVRTAAGYARVAGSVGEALALHKEGRDREAWTVLERAHAPAYT